VKAEVWLLSWDFQPRWCAPANKGLLQTQIWMHTSDFFQYWLGLGLGLIMRICEDCDRAVPTPWWYFHFVISRCSLLLPSIMILNRQNTKLFSEQFQPKGLNYLLLREATNGAYYESSCTAARSLFPGNVGNTGACRAIIYHTKILENRATKWNTQKQTKSKEGAKQARKHQCFNPILVATRVPFAEYIIPRALPFASYLSRPFG